MSGFEAQFRAYAALTEKHLEDSIGVLEKNSKDYALPVVNAMRYSLLSGGKRLRPVLLLAAYSILQKDTETALPFAAGLEMIHTYSLIHDDLPAMDNDALRRGKPTNHMVFGEAIALLAGDALLNLAIEMMGASEAPLALKALHAIAVRSGSRGMIAGQTADITLSHQRPDQDKVSYIHLHKTADMFCAAVLAGLILAGASARQLDAGERYARHLGIAFQIVDDLLDLKGDAAVLGKETHKDQEQGKLTWPALFGIKKSEEDAEREIALAIKAAEELEGPEGFLGELARRTLNRVQ